MRIQLILLAAILLIALLYSSRTMLQRKKKAVVMISAVLTLFSGLRTWWISDQVLYPIQKLQRRKLAGGRYGKLG